MVTPYFRKPIFILITILSILGCAAPLLTNSDRGNYKVKDLDPLKPAVLEVNVSVLPLQEPPEKLAIKEKTFFDLADSIPHTFLNVVGSKAKNTTEILEAK